MDSMRSLPDLAGKTVRRGNPRRRFHRASRRQLKNLVTPTHSSCTAFGGSDCIDSTLRFNYEENLT